MGVSVEESTITTNEEGNRSRSTNQPEATTIMPKALPNRQRQRQQQTGAPETELI